MIRIVGATGLVGSATLRQLAARGVPGRTLWCEVLGRRLPLPVLASRQSLATWSSLPASTQRWTGSPGRSSSLLSTRGR
jgi:hypothetical protein